MQFWQTACRNGDWRISGTPSGLAYPRSPVKASKTPCGEWGGKTWFNIDRKARLVREGLAPRRRTV